MTFSVRRSLAVVLLGILGCSSDLILPPSDDGTQIGAMNKLWDDQQTGPVAEQLLDPLIVEVITENGEPAVGITVTFQVLDPAGGTVAPSTATTNSEGQAVAYWTFGTLPGSYTVLARITGVEGDTAASDKVAEFHASAHAGEPDTLAPEIPLLQPGARGEPVEDRPQVRVVDRFGNPVADVPVAWQVTAGDGQVSSAVTMTDAEGKASVDWVLGNRIGFHKLTAAIEDAIGSPIVFMAQVFL
ncbi:MAG TPA: Ig-like domain-containing protein [Gemmatimonadales bacterium]|nr:Ig-like domain-containing protein [Gemmatimonadales bacterium]